VYESLIALRHHTVHRLRVNVQALRQWISDASTLVAALGDSTGAARFAPLGKYLTTLFHRMEADKREAEDRLLAKVKDLAAKRTELDRVEQEAMNEYHEEHKRLSARALANFDEFHASIHVDHGLRVSIGDSSSTELAHDNSEETSPTEPLKVEKPSSSELVSSIVGETL
jgi:hypothetical protein